MHLTSVKTSASSFAASADSAAWSGPHWIKGPRKLPPYFKRIANSLSRVSSIYTLPLLTSQKK